MEDYKEIMKELLLQYYDMIPSGDLIQMQTSQMLTWFKGVIPGEPIDEHAAFDVLKELGFTTSQKILTKKICIFEGDKKYKIPPEYEEVEVTRILVWNLYERI